ncbi:MAG: N-acetylmuramoyl-L-alanine amidase family protein [Lachnospiraceae bacterium]|nr:N-acetylmuramoyl-L-alanine amidase family protein [Lachnospiraceae bacterium]
MKKLHFLALLVLLFALGSLTVFAAGEAEDNGSRASANAISLNTTVTGNISSYNDEDWYKFTLSQAGAISVQFGHQDLTSSNLHWRLYLYNSEGQNITGDTDKCYEFDGNGTGYSLPEIGLPAGTYYVRVISGYYTESSSYTVRVSFTASSVYEKEYNGSRASATSMNLNTFYKGSIYADYADEDWYKFTLSQAGVLTVTFSHKDLTDSQYYWGLYLYNSEGQNITGDSEKRFDFAGDGTGYSLPEVGLPAGTYYIRVTMLYGHSDSTYSVKAGFTASSTYEKEYNGSRASATPINLNTVYKGSIYVDYGDEDWYKVTLSQAGALTVQFTHKDLTDSQSYWRVYLYNSEGKNITGEYEKWYQFDGDGTGYSLPEVGLPAGTYYIRVTADYHNDSTYSLKAGFTASTVYEKEYNGSRDSATPIKANVAYKGSTYADSYDEDYYKIVLTKNDTVKIRFAHPIISDSNNYWQIYLLDAEGNTVNIDGSVYYIDGNVSDVTLPAVGLSAGTYYVRITCGFYHSNHTYTLTVNAPNNGVAAGWKHNSSGWWYQRADGTYPVSQWEKISGKWYHFDSKGYMQTGWQKFGTSWYYLGTDGAMKTGWQKVNGSWYYMNDKGVMQTGWLKLGSNWYYMSSGGVMQTGWKKIGNVTYFFKPDGAMAAREWWDGYYLNQDGSWTYKYRARWVHNNKGWWYGDDSGWYAKSATVRIDGKSYTFDAAGYMK